MNSFGLRRARKAYLTGYAERVRLLRDLIRINVMATKIPGGENGYPAQYPLPVFTSEDGQSNIEIDFSDWQPTKYEAEVLGLEV